MAGGMKYRGILIGEGNGECLSNHCGRALGGL